MSKHALPHSKIYHGPVSKCHLPKPDQDTSRRGILANHAARSRPACAWRPGDACLLVHASPPLAHACLVRLPVLPSTCAQKTAHAEMPDGPWGRISHRAPTQISPWPFLGVDAPSGPISPLVQKPCGIRAVEGNQRASAGTIDRETAQIRIPEDDAEDGSGCDDARGSWRAPVCLPPGVQDSTTRDPCSVFP